VCVCLCVCVCAHVGVHVGVHIDFIYVLGAKPEQRDLVKVLYGLSEHIRLDKSCDPAAKRCLATYGLDTAYCMVCC
jgi:hypothetical protein